jgi:phosphoserine phosphatase
LAGRIAPEDREAVLSLAGRGHRQLVASCGTADMSERILAHCGLRQCFQALFANRFVFDRGRIAGMRLEVCSGRAKLEVVESLGVDPAGAVAVGRGGRRAAEGLSCHPVASPAGVLDLVRRLGG